MDRQITLAEINDEFGTARIFILQNLYDLADMKVMYEILDSRAFAAFCCVKSPDEVPDGVHIYRSSVIHKK